MRTIKLATALASLWTAVPAYPAACSARCHVVKGWSNFSHEFYQLVGTGLNYDEALKDLLNQCAAKALQRGQTSEYVLESSAPPRPGQFGAFEPARACLGGGPG